MIAIPAVDPDHPCLPCIVIDGCTESGCLVIRCGNCGIDTHFRHEVSLDDLGAWVEEH